MRSHLVRFPFQIRLSSNAYSEVRTAGEASNTPAVYAMPGHPIAGEVVFLGRGCPGDRYPSDPNGRIPTGVAVVARTTDAAGVDLATGDVIHAVNGTPIADVETLRTLLSGFKHGDAVVLQVERRGGLEFVGFEMN